MSGIRPWTKQSWVSDSWSCVSDNWIGSPVYRMWSPINVFLSLHIWQCHRTWMMTVRELKLGKVSEQWRGTPRKCFSGTFAMLSLLRMINDQFRQSQHSAWLAVFGYLHIWVRIWVPTIITPRRTVRIQKRYRSMVALRPVGVIIGCGCSVRQHGSTTPSK